MNYQQQRILDVLKFALSFFEQHHLRYVACGGTVLGAVRHHGFIPWDDDVDIYLPREDYNRLLALTNEVKEAGYRVVSLADKGYYLPFCKITDTKSTIWEFEELPFVFGFFIDVFPLDGTSESDETIMSWYERANVLNYKLRVALCKYTFREFACYLCKGEKYRCIEILKSWLTKPLTEKYINDFKKLERMYSSDKGDKCLCVTQWPGKIFKTRWFDNPIELDFEDIKLKVPRNYDEYLTLLYGDYNTFPPEDKRHSEHQQFYFNSNKALTVKQVREILKNDKREHKQE